MCDILLMSERAHLADSHMSVGLVAGDGGAAFWHLLTHIMKSREYLFTGDRITAATAVELGLASRATAPAGFAAEEATMQTDEHRQRLLALRPREQ